MAEDNEPVSREGRVSRGPLLFVLGVLIIVAIVGAIISTNARDDNAETAAVTESTTTSIEVADTAYPTVEPTVTPQTEAPGDSGSIEVAGGDACTPEALLKAVDDSGQAAEGVVDSATVTRFNCIDDYAFTRLSAPGLDEAEAYFKRGDGQWDMLVLGTAVDPESQGIPSDTVRQLVAD